MGMHRIRLANLLPEVTERNIRAALASYGEIVSIQDEIWSKVYRYKVANGLNVIKMKMAKHVPSQMNIAGHRAIPSYDGQPVTCYGCGDSGYINKVCPKRREGGMVTSDLTPNIWTHVTAKGAQNPLGNDDKRIEVILQREPYEQASRYSPSVDDLMTTDTPLDIGGEQNDPSHQRMHDLLTQDEKPPLPTTQPVLSPKK